MNVNNTNKTSYAQKGKTGFKRGNPGRPKGAKDKVSRNIKEAYEYVFEKRDGAKGFLKWVNANKRNTELFYQWYSKMLPSNISGDIDANVTVKIIKTITDKRPEEG